MAPVEPLPSQWRFPDVSSADEHGVVGVGPDLEPGTVLEAYRSGLFPMPLDVNGPVGWWSPDPRGVIPLDGLTVSRSLRRSCRRYEVRVDTAFEEVIARCADASRPGAWIRPDISDAYRALHDLGWAHSVEAWDESGLAGGLYGVAIGGLFAGESMFHLRADASKVALVALVGFLRSDEDANSPARLLDVQWVTDHLASLGAVAIRREQYLARLAGALGQSLPTVFG